MLRENEGEDQFDRSGENEVLHRVKGEMNILHTIKRRKASWIGRILRRNCLLKYYFSKYIIIEVTKRRGRRYKQLQYALKETSGYWKLKEKALDLCGELALEGFLDLT